MNRSFAKATIEINGGRRIPAVIACCSECGHTEKISANNRSGSIPPEAAANRFRHNGWFIANREGKDICPKCNEKAAKSKVIKMEKVVHLKQPVVEVDKPREMSKDDRRVIFVKLNDVYLDESSGYASGWSDKRVSTDLGVPQAWVRVVREENFGDEGLNEDARPLLMDAKQIIADIRVMEKIITERIVEATKQKDDLMKRADHIAGKVAAMEKLFK